MDMCSDVTGALTEKSRCGFVGERLLLRLLLMILLGLLRRHFATRRVPMTLHFAAAACKVRLILGSELVGRCYHGTCDRRRRPRKCSDRGWQCIDTLLSNQQINVRLRICLMQQTKARPPGNLIRAFEEIAKVLRLPSLHKPNTCTLRNN